MEASRFCAASQIDNSERTPKIPAVWGVKDVSVESASFNARLAAPIINDGFCRMRLQSNYLKPTVGTYSKQTE
jgi:hypothetical protein